MFYGIVISPQDIPHMNMNVGIFCGILPIPCNIVMDLNNVMLIAMLFKNLKIHRKVPKYLKNVALVPSLRISNFRGLKNWFTHKHNYPSAFQV